MKRSSRWWWPSFLVGAVLFLVIGNGALYGIVVPLAAVAIALSVPGARPPTVPRIDRQDLAVIGGLYLAVVALFSLAFQVFTRDNVAGLFLTFAAGLVLGVAGPIIYTVWVRRRPLADLGFTRRNLGPAVALTMVLSALQFAMTLWGYDLPAPVDWVPLLVLSVTVGLFEAVFFRGFIQTRLVSSVGSVGGVGGAAALYALYHVGYGMGPAEMLFLFGLGVVYGVAYAAVHNLAVLWPLLIPLGSFYNNLTSGDIRMPWAAILGFADVLALMAAAWWLAARRERRRADRDADGPTRRSVSRAHP